VRRGLRGYSHDEYAIKREIYRAVEKIF
jgi:hypothetical protein